jgi:hypothetical protein
MVAYKLDDALVAKYPTSKEQRRQSIRQRSSRNNGKATTNGPATAATKHPPTKNHCCNLMNTPMTTPLQF